jgi:hypothetical protein
MEAKKFEILEQTKISLEEVGRQYLEQRRYIEEQLERRRQLKLKGASQGIQPYFYNRLLYPQKHLASPCYRIQH